VLKQMHQNKLRSKNKKQNYQNRHKDLSGSALTWPTSTGEDKSRSFTMKNKGDTNSGSHPKTQVHPKQHLIVFLQREFSHSLNWLT
jgi:hypothetical protein